MTRPEIAEELKEKVSKWLKDPYDLQTQSQVQELISSPEELFDSFYKPLDFGTAGLRGKMGVGPNRINIYTIREASQGLANYILQKKIANPSVAIGFDNRHNSKLFASETAKVLSSNGIRVYLCQELRPTPFISFICKYKCATAAVMITASHNPPEYNGYKVYWEGGGQIVPPHDHGIIDEVKKIQDPSMVTLDEKQSNLIELLGESDDQAFINALQELQNYPGEALNSEVKIVYTPLHGAGLTLIPKALDSWGFTNYSLVDTQTDPSGDFPNAASPNPEDRASFDHAIKLALKEKASLCLATDPDADRLGLVEIIDEKPFYYTGNQVAQLCLYHLLTTYQNQHRLSKNLACVSTIVSTRLLKEMCASFGIKYFETLTGFKYIGELMKSFEENPEEIEFLFGAEESYGYLYGHHVRDKDAIIIACLLAEISSCQLKRRETLYNLLEEIYHRFGFYYEKQHSISFKESKHNRDCMQKVFETLRADPPKHFNNLKVVNIADYYSSEETNLLSNQKKPLKLPKSNVLTFTLESGDSFTFRPSGTEPKVKIYAMTRSPFKGNLVEMQQRAAEGLDKTLKWITKTFFAFN